MIRGKRSRIDRLPLPADVGEALADYLRRGRPRGFGRTVFLRVQAPLVGLSGDGVSEVVVRACRRAGIAPVRAHRLRHTIATELLRAAPGCRRSVRCCATRASIRPRSMPRSTASAVATGAAVAREPVMSALAEAVGDYLALRRALGYKLEAHGRCCRSSPSSSSSGKRP